MVAARQLALIALFSTLAAVTPTEQGQQERTSPQVLWTFEAGG
jgi:hypothetical protein